MGACYSLLSSCMSAQTNVARSILKSKKVSNWTKMSKSTKASERKKIGFRDNVEVFYFDRCPQYDHAPRDKFRIPVGMSSKCFHIQLEPLSSDDRDTRLKVRRVLFIEREIEPVSATSSRHRRVNRSYSIPCLVVSSSTIGEVTPFCNSSSSLPMEEEVDNLDTVFILPPVARSFSRASRKNFFKKSKKFRKRRSSI